MLIAIDSFVLFYMPVWYVYVQDKGRQGAIDYWEVN